MDFFIVKDQDNYGVVPVLAYYRSSLELQTFWDVNGLFFYLLEFDHIGLHPFDGIYTDSLPSLAASYGKMLYFHQTFVLTERVNNSKDPIGWIIKQLNKKLNQIDDGLPLRLDSKLQQQATDSDLIHRLNRGLFSQIGHESFDQIGETKSEIYTHIARAIAWGWSDATHKWPQTSESFELVHFIYQSLGKLTERESLAARYHEGFTQLTIEYGFDHQKPFIYSEFKY